MPSKLSNSFLGLGCFTPLLGITLLVYFFYQQSFLLGCIAVVASFVVSIILFVLMSLIDGKRKRKQMKFLQTFQPDRVEFQKLKSFTSYDLLEKIAIDQQQKKMYLWVPDSNKGENITKAFVGMPYVIKTYNFSDLLAIKFTENDHQMASAQKDTDYKSFLLNKIPEEETTTNHSTHPPIDKISSMDLEVIVNDNMKPKHRLRFYHEPYRKIRKDSPEYEAYYKGFQKWFNLLKTIIYETEQNIERSFVAIDSALTEETFSELIPKEKTQITIDIDTKQPSFSLSEVSPDPSKEDSDTMKDNSKQEQAVEKPTSYFEQLVEKNRRQMRGDYTDE